MLTIPILRYSDKYKDLVGGGGNVWHEGRVTENPNLYHCDPWMICNLGFLYFHGVSGSYMDAVFKLVAHKESEIWTSLSHSFTKGGLL